MSAPNQTPSRATGSDPATGSDGPAGRRAQAGRSAPATTAPPVTAPRMTGRQKLVLALLLGAQFMIAVDFSILNVALPVVGEGLGFALPDLQWIATAFALAAAGFTLLLGRVADLVGRKRVFVGGMVVLGLSSALGGLATSPEVLLTARVLQGLATAAVTPAGLALLTTAFKEGPLRERALGLNGALMSAGFTAGAILGGLLTDLLSWRWAFFVNVPVAALVVALAPSVIADSRPAVRPRLDVPGAATVTGGLLLLVYGLTQAGASGWTTPTTLAALLAGAALLIGFWFVEKRTAAPLVPVHILKRRSVIWGNATGLIAFVTETSLVFLLTLYLQEVLGYSPLATGLAFGVLGIGTVIGGTLGGRTVGRFGNRTGHRHRRHRPGRRHSLPGRARHLRGVDLAAAGGHVHRRHRQHADDRRLHGHRDLRPPRRGTGPGHRPRHHDPAGRHHAGHPGDERRRHRPDVRPG